MKSADKLCAKTGKSKEAERSEEIDLSREGLVWVYGPVLTMSNMERSRRRLWKVFWTAWVERMTKERMLPTNPKHPMMVRSTPSTRKEKVFNQGVGVEES